MPILDKVVTGRNDARNFDPPDVPWAVIQIATEEGDWPKVNKTKQMGCLQLFFADADHEVFRERAERMGSKMFNEDTANQIFDFVAEMKEKGVEQLLIHCEAGVCRSPAVAAALDKVDIGTDDYWFKNKSPNAFVYRIMLETAHKRGLIGSPEDLPEGKGEMNTL